jgi:hypothetical protein
MKDSLATARGTDFARFVFFPPEDFAVIIRSYEESIKNLARSLSGNTMRNTLLGSQLTRSSADQ